MLSIHLNLQTEIHISTPAGTIRIARNPNQATAVVIDCPREYRISRRQLPPPPSPPANREVRKHG